MEEIKQKVVRSDILKATFFTLYFPASVSAFLKSFRVCLVKETSHSFVFLNQARYGSGPGPHRKWQALFSSCCLWGRASGSWQSHFRRRYLWFMEVTGWQENRMHYLPLSPPCSGHSDWLEFQKSLEFSRSSTSGSYIILSNLCLYQDSRRERNSKGT